MSKVSVDPLSGRSFWGDFSIMITLLTTPGFKLMGTARLERAESGWKEKEKGGSLQERKEKEKKLRGDGRLQRG